MTGKTVHHKVLMNENFMVNENVMWCTFSWVLFPKKCTVFKENGFEFFLWKSFLS